MWNKKVNISHAGKQDNKIVKMCMFELCHIPTEIDLTTLLELKMVNPCFE